MPDLFRPYKHAGTGAALLSIRTPYRLERRAASPSSGHALFGRSNTRYDNYRLGPSRPASFARRWSFKRARRPRSRFCSCSGLQTRRCASLRIDGATRAAESGVEFGAVYILGQVGLGSEIEMAEIIGMKHREER